MPVVGFTWMSPRESARRQIARSGSSALRTVAALMGHEPEPGASDRPHLGVPSAKRVVAEDAAKATARVPNRDRDPRAVESDAEVSDRGGSPGSLQHQLPDEAGLSLEHLSPKLDVVLVSSQ